MLVVDDQPHPLQFSAQEFISQKEGLLPRIGAQTVVPRRLARSEHVQKRLSHAHAPELFHIPVRRFAGIVGYKQNATARTLQRIQKIQRPVQQAVTQIEGTVHVQHKALYLGKPFPEGVLRHKRPTSSHLGHKKPRDAHIVTHPGEFNN